jgi:branched-chain amino acid transport system permease protein
MTRQRLLLFVLLFSVLTLAALPFFASAYYVRFFMLTFMYVSLASSWNIISGYTGYVSFGHSAFFGLGAYTAALAILHWNLHWLPASLLGALLATLVSLPLGFILLRLRGPYFAISMLGLAAAFEIVAASWVEVTKGGSGLNLPPVLAINDIYYAMGATMLVVIGLSYKLITSPFGLRLLAIREDEQAASVMGINTTTHKVTAFALSAFFPGLVGGFYAWSLSYIDPNSVFRSILSVGMVIMTMFGGIGTVTGPIIGGVLLNILSELFWARLPEFHQAAYGTLIILIVLALPGGIISVMKTRGLAQGRGV